MRNTKTDLIETLDIDSSYRRNTLGVVLYDFVRSTKPQTVLEFGSLQGYSAVCIGLALRDNGFGTLHAYDLWENYRYKSFPMLQAKENVKLHGLEGVVTFGEMNFSDWVSKPTEFDLLHLDISNDGDTILEAYKALKIQIAGGSNVLFEGGSEQRDQEPWMIEYNKRPIRSVLNEVPFEILDGRWPSISVIKE